MKIIGLIPVWRRPEVTTITVKYIPEWIKPIYVLSEDDPEFLQNRDIIEAHGYTVVHCNNFPVSVKHNAGINYALGLRFEWDYLMTINSDDIIHPDLINLYKPYIESKNPFFGIGDLNIYDKVSKRSVLRPDYNNDMCMGAGRMIHREVIEEMDGYVYPMNKDSGLDTYSRNRIVESGFNETYIKTDLKGYVLDIKTNTNINTFYLMQNRENEFRNWTNRQTIERFGIRVEDQVFFNP